MEVLIYIESGPYFWKLCIIQFMTKNLQTKIYLTLFSDSKNLVSLRSNKIFFRVISEKTYQYDFFELTRMKISYLPNENRYPDSEKSLL